MRPHLAFGIAIAACLVTTPLAIATVHPRQQQVRATDTTFALAGWDERERRLIAGLRTRRSQIAHAKRRPNGQVFLLGENVLPACTTPPVSTDSSALVLGRCAVRALGPLLTASRESADPATLEVHRVKRSSDDSLPVDYLTLRQKHRGWPVDGSDLDLIVGRSRLLQISGRVYGPAELAAIRAPRELPDSAARVRRAMALTGRQLRPARFYADPARRTFISEWESFDRDGTRFLIDESTGRLIGTLDMRKREPGPTRKSDVNLVRKATRVMSYRNGVIRDDVVDQNVRIDQKSLFMPELCVGYLDHGSDADDGEAKVGLNVEGEWVPDESEVYHRVTTDCGADAPFMRTSNTDTWTFRLMNVYFWMHDLRTMANTRLGAYDDFIDWQPIDAENLEVIVKDDDDCAFATPGATKYKITLPVTTDGCGNDTPLALATIGHEYGHFVHYMYDLTVPGGNMLGNGIEEGFAESNVFRHALFRWRNRASRTQDSFGATFGYTTNIRGSVDHSLDIRNGEMLPDERGEEEIHDPFSSICDDDGGEEHDCGQVLPIVYWELAWNQCRIPYRGCEGPDFSILRTSSYADEPELLVNRAYTSAIVSANNSTTILGFFDFVAGQYFMRNIFGLISDGELQRAMSVLDHHCVGPDSDCLLRHTLPGSPLPAVFVRAARLNRPCGSAPCKSHLVRIPDMTSVSGQVRNFTTSIFGIEIPEPGATFLTLDDANDRATMTVNVTTAGVYTIDGLVRQIGFSNPSFKVQVDGGSEIVWHVSDTDAFQWEWSRTGPDVPLAAGTHTLRFKHRENIQLEAILLTLLPDTDGDLVPDADDNCPNVANADQGDMDGDGRGDVCDRDRDGDGVEGCHFEFTGFAVIEVCPNTDNCTDVANADQRDRDGDGTGDVCDTDMDGDGVINTADNCPGTANADQRDADGDGRGDACPLIGPIEGLPFDLRDFLRFDRLCLKAPFGCRPPDPDPCPYCFDAFGKLPLIQRPSYVLEIEDAISALTRSPSPTGDDGKSALLVLERALRRMPARGGGELRDSAIARLQRDRRQGFLQPLTRASVLAALNADEVSLRLPVRISGTVTNENVMDFAGLLSVRGLQADAQLTFRPGAPGRGSGEFLWPVVTYEIVPGRGSSTGPYVLTFSVGGFVPELDASELAILEWRDGKYADITRRIDVKLRTITGETQALGSYVIVARQ